MPRNGLKAVESAEPNELYDGLSQEAKDQWDAIGALGFTPEKGAAGLWYARKTGQTAAEAIGPADGLGALHSQVKASLPDEEFVSTDDLDDADSESVPSSRLPGMEEPALDVLDRQADICIDALERKKKAAAEYTDQDEKFRKMLRDHGRRRYSRRGLSLVINETEKLVIKEEKQKAPKDSNLKAAA